MLISIENLSKYYGANLILENINLVVEDNDRIGLIGANGAGKSTLLNIIEGTLDFEEGLRNLKSDITIGFLKQNSGLNPTGTIQKELDTVFTVINEAIANMHEVEKIMSQLDNHDSQDYNDLLKKYTNLQSIIDANDGYNKDVKINMILNGMGFADKPRNTIISTLSGGEKTRLALCKLLLENPELLILDEPTNHLDFKTLIWLEDYLKTYKGALLIVSHDRFFLNSLVTSICEVEHCKLERYKGNYSQFAIQKEERLQRQQKLYDAQQIEKKRLEDYVAKNIVCATSSASAKSKRKAIEHMELIDKPLPPPKTVKISFQYDIEPVKDVLHINDLCLSVGKRDNKKQLMQKFDLDVLRGEKIAIIGENGIGKSSMLKAIQNMIPIDKGSVNWGRNVKSSYFDQENGNLTFEKTVLMELWDRHPTMYEHYIRTILGNVLITQEESKKLVGELSGGERAKLKFAIMMMEKGNVLILDEPSNHLDLESKEILDKALCDFTGTIIMVSHDRYLLTKVPTKIVEITSNGKIEYLGNYYDYLDKQKIEEKVISTKKAELSDNKANYNKSKEQRSVIAALRREKAELEKSIDDTEKEITELDEIIALPETSTDYEKLSNHCLRVEELRRDLDRYYTRWIEINEEI